MHNRVIMVPEPSLYMIFLKLFAGRILEVEAQGTPWSNGTS